jgi:putative OmpL-like beta-barrel porin-2
MAGAVRTVAVAVAVTLAAIAPAWAQETSNEDLKKEVDTLKKKVAALETENPSAAKTGLPVSISSDKPAEETDTVLQDINKWIKEVKLSGFVDAGYVYNFSRPDNRANGNTGGPVPYPTSPGSFLPGSIRAFDKESNAFYLHNAQLMLDKAPTDKSRVGGRVKFSMGQDADVISSGGSASGDNFDITEGYVQILAGVGRGLTITVGKFATLAGSEVIESKDDLNYSRSLLFTWAIPFTHTGFRATYSAMDQLDLTLGFNNGWDQLTDNNDAKTLEFSATVKPNNDWKFILNLYYGAEKNPTAGAGGPTQPGDKRFLFDFVVAGKIEKLTLGFNWDWAFQQDDVVKSGKLDDSHWTGAAVYAKYEIDPLYSPGIRFEYFRDSDGVRTGTKQTLMEFTLTNEFNIVDGLIFRFEYRFDRSSEDIFLKQDRSKSNESTVGFEVIWIFG